MDRAFVPVFIAERSRVRNPLCLSNYPACFVCFGCVSLSLLLAGQHGEESRSQHAAKPVGALGMVRVRVTPQG